MSKRRKNITNNASVAIDDKITSISTSRIDVDPGVRPSQAVSVLVDYYTVLAMVLGGCCSNVWAYEQLLKMNPRIGSALTFSQMLFITVQSLPSFLWVPPRRIIPRLKPRQVPLTQWALQVLLLTTGSLLNNWVFAFNVPLTIQIVFRSGGLAVSMLFGYVFLHRKYSLLQIVSVTLVSVGVILATLSRPTTAKSAPLQSAEDIRRYAIGVGMLVLSVVLTGFMGLLQERTYRKYGPCWKEGVFYTHCLSLPIFLFLVQDVKQGILSLSDTPLTSSAYSAYLVLAGNLVSQLVCVSGVNRLSSQVSSVSTNLILTTRKALSLCFSVWWFGNGWNAQLGFGACMVFVGTFMFSIGAAPAPPANAGAGGGQGPSNKKD